MLTLLALILPEAGTVADGAIQPHVAVDSDGAIYVTFIRRGNIEVAVSTDKGKTFSTPVVAIDGNGKIQGGMQRGPRIGVDAKKNVYVSGFACFDAAEFANKYPKRELFLAVSSDAGKTFGKPLQVNEIAKMASEGLHWMAVTASGETHLSWLDDRAGKKGVFYKKIIDAGKKPGKDVCVVPGPVCECCAAVVAVDDKGVPTVMFRDGGNKPSREIYVSRSENKGQSFAAPVQVNRAATKLPS